MADDSAASADDVMPPIANQLLGLAWVVLFAGRWIVVQLLLAGGVLTASMVSDLDQRVLVRVYLALLMVTIIVVALRTMRAGRAHWVRRPSDVPGAEAQLDVAEPESPLAADRRPEAGD